ncbi:MAG: AAA family ATPase [Gammaproteobacteria bacterium]|nr:AAA family ATPase [Gammaproteobacteria bacterium]MDH4254149.1 AAA family ATPase [Gammaproteobacteria bacterium]MDH5309484.1 AAA family ATPase [Gammaproteobacteria bacterium]
MHRSGTSCDGGSSLVDGLLRAGAYEHPAESIELIETHISWVILAGDFAYKIKKSLVLDFLDFGDLQKRRHFCDEELRLNRPWAPDLYLDVVPITLDEGLPRIGGTGDPVEYALRMRRFDPGLRLDRQLASGRLAARDMKELGRVIAERHGSAPRVSAGRRDHYLTVTSDFMWDNFAAIEGAIGENVLGPLRDWTRAELERHEPLIAARFDAGRVRDCHGDLHLGNLVRLAGGIATFDCIEFNEDLRAIDVICDIAFLVMDLVEHDRADLAAQFLNRYLEAGGDYEGVALLDLFFVYRCLVRAKVAVIRAAERDDPALCKADLAEARRYCEMAGKQASKGEPLLVLMTGLSGSGKTWVSGQLMASLPAIRVRSDVERRRLFGLAETEASGSGVASGIYSSAAGRKVYARLCELAALLLQTRHNVILDAAFLRESERRDALQIAESAGYAALIVRAEAPEAVLRERILDRRARGTDASEADLAVLEFQLAKAEPLTADEMKRALVIDNQGPLDATRLAARARNLARRVVA